jgi:hypothetical protein
MSSTTATIVAQGIESAPILTRRARTVRRRERTALQHLRAERGEVRRIDAVRIGAAALEMRQRVVARDREPSDRHARAERNADAERHVRHIRQHAHATLCLGPKGIGLRGRSAVGEEICRRRKDPGAGGQLHARQHQPVGIQTERNGADVLETAHEQARADEQHD